VCFCYTFHCISYCANENVKKHSRENLLSVTDALGRMKKTIDALGRTSFVDYDADDRVRCSVTIFEKSYGKRLRLVDKPAAPRFSTPSLN
jgi:hypothetical protein